MIVRGSNALNENMMKLRLHSDNYLIIPPIVGLITEDSRTDVLGVPPIFQYSQSRIRLVWLPNLLRFIAKGYKSQDY